MPGMTVAECEQLCYDVYCSELQKAKDAATRYFLFIPYTDGDVFEPLASAAKSKYANCIERCKE